MPCAFVVAYARAKHGIAIEHIRRLARGLRQVALQFRADGGVEPLRLGQLELNGVRARAARVDVLRRAFDVLAEVVDQRVAARATIDGVAAAAPIQNVATAAAADLVVAGAALYEVVTTATVQVVAATRPANLLTGP